MPPRNFFSCLLLKFFPMLFSRRQKSITFKICLISWFNISLCRLFICINQFKLITKIKCILFSFSNDWGLYHQSIFQYNKNSELSAFRKIKFIGQIANNCPNELIGTKKMLTQTVDEKCWYVVLTRLQWNMN